MYYKINIEITEVAENSTQAGVQESERNLLRLNDSDEDLQTVVKRAENMLGLYKKD